MSNEQKLDPIAEAAKWNTMQDEGASTDPYGWFVPAAGYETKFMVNRTGGRAMTDNTQELDDILFDLCDLSYASFTTQEEADRVADQLDYDRAKAKQALIDWHNKQILESLDRLLVEVKQAYDKEGDFLEMAVCTIEAELNVIQAKGE